MHWPTLLPLSLGYSLLYCVLFTGLLLLGQAISRDTMLPDYPPAIQERYGPRSERGTRTARLLGAVNGLLFVLVPVLAMADLGARVGEAPGFAEGFVFGTILFLVLTIVDLLVLDWWLFCTVRPALLVLPGTEDMPEYRDKRFHFDVLVPKPFPYPLLFIPAYGLAVGGITALVGLWNS